MSEKISQERNTDNDKEILDFELSRLLKNWASEKKPSANSGNNGLVFRIDASEIPETLSRKGDTALKTLKIYRPKQARREHEMLSKAEEIILDYKGAEDIASVPSPIDERDLDIDEDVKEYLNSNDSKLEKKVGIILMDFIEGVDLATFLYKNLLILKGYAPENLENLDFSVLSSLVKKELGTTAETQESNSMEATMSEVRKYLKKQGFVLDPAIIEKIRRTIDLFHENNLYHNDLHEKNIMIGNDNSVFVIDFDHASVGPSETDDKYKLLDDYGLVRRLQSLTVSEETELNEARKLAKSELEQSVERVSKDPELKKDFEKLKMMMAKRQTGLEDYLAVISSQETKIRDFLAMLVILSGESGKMKEKIIDFVDKQLNEKRIRPYILNQFLTLKRYLNTGL